LIDLIATDMPNLLQKLNGRVVDGKPLNTAGAQLTEIKMSPAERVFQKLWRPEVSPLCSIQDLSEGGSSTQPRFPRLIFGHTPLAPCRESHAGFIRALFLIGASLIGVPTVSFSLKVSFRTHHTASPPRHIPSSKAFLSSVGRAHSYR